MGIIVKAFAVILAGGLALTSVAAEANQTTGYDVIASSFAGLLNISLCSINTSKARVTDGEQFVLKWNTFNIQNPYLWHEGKGGGEETITKSGSRTMTVGTDVRSSASVSETEWFGIGTNAEQARVNPLCKTEITIVPAAAAQAGTNANGVTFSASPTKISPGSSSTLTWDIRALGTKRCFIDPGSFTQQLSSTGSLSVKPARTTAYAIRCLKGISLLGAENVATVTVTVVGSESAPASGSGSSVRGSAFGGRTGGSGGGGGSEGSAGARSSGGFGGGGGFGGFDGMSGGGSFWGPTFTVPSSQNNTCLSATGCGGTGSIKGL